MNNSRNIYYPRARSRDLVIQPSSDEVLVYDAASNQAHCLNPTAAAIWYMCDGTKSVTQIAGRLANGSSSDKVHEDLVWTAIDQLSERKLLDEAAPPTAFPGESRRQALKRIGATAVIALPIIATIVVPQSALGQTSCACVTPGNCITQTTCPSTVNCNGSQTCAP